MLELIFAILPGGMALWTFALLAFVVLVTVTFLFLASRYKRCPSDKILVVFGRVGEGKSSRCIHGGGTLVWPLIQDYRYLSLTPITIGIPLQNALSLQNIRINVPSTFTVGISTENEIMQSAAERLLELRTTDIEAMAREIIFGQLRLTVASLTIEQINQDRESFLASIRKNVEPELNKIGLYLINVNITDITDESTYIESIGKKAAAEAIHRARVDVAEQVKVGAMGEAEAKREMEISVAEKVAKSHMGQKKAEADKRVYIQQQETAASVGEAESMREREIRIAQTVAESQKGQKQADADRRVYVQQQEAEAVKGENEASARIAEYNAELSKRQAAANQIGEVAQRQAQAEIQKAQYKSEQQRLIAEDVVRKEIEKQKIEIDAEAEAEKTRREARGVADAILFKYEAEAKGIKQVLESKALGYKLLMDSCGGDAKAAATLLMVEKIEHIVEAQVEAIQNLKIDKITVWDGGSSTGKGNATSEFISGLVRSLPPLHEIAGMAGVELPGYLGKMTSDDDEPAQKPTMPRQGGQIPTGVVRPPANPQTAPKP